MLSNCIIKLENTDVDTKAIKNICRMLGTIKTLRKVKITSEQEINAIGSTAALEILNS